MLSPKIAKKHYPPPACAGGFFVLAFCTLSRRQIRRDSIQHVSCKYLQHKEKGSLNMKQLARLIFLDSLFVQRKLLYFKDCDSKEIADIIEQPQPWNGELTPVLSCRHGLAWHGLPLFDAVKFDGWPRPCWRHNGGILPPLDIPRW